MENRFLRFLIYCRLNACPMQNRCLTHKVYIKWCQYYRVWLNAALVARPVFLGIQLREKPVRQMMSKIYGSLGFLKI